MACVDGVPTSPVGPTARTPPADGRELIGSLLVFADLDAAELDALAASVEWLSVPAGTRLFSVGDPPDGMYGLVAGRVRFFAEYDGRAVLTAEAEPGITFGEESLLVGGGGSRTAVAVRDPLVVRLPPDVFSTLMATSPRPLATRASSTRSTAARSSAASSGGRPRPNRPTCTSPPDLASVGFSGFGRIREAVEIGYTAAMEALSGWRPS